MYLIFIDASGQIHDTSKMADLFCMYVCSDTINQAIRLDIKRRGIDAIYLKINLNNNVINADLALAMLNQPGHILCSAQSKNVTNKSLRHPKKNQN